MSDEMVDIHNSENMKRYRNLLYELDGLYMEYLDAVEFKDSKAMDSILKKTPPILRDLKKIKCLIYSTYDSAVKLNNIVRGFLFVLSKTNHLQYTKRHFGFAKYACIDVPCYTFYQNACLHNNIRHAIFYAKKMDPEMVYDYEPLTCALNMKSFQLVSILLDRGARHYDGKEIHVPKEDIATLLNIINARN